MNAFKSGSLYQFRENEPFLAELNFRAINRKKVPASFFSPIQRKSEEENPLPARGITGVDSGPVREPAVQNSRHIRTSGPHNAGKTSEENRSIPFHSLSVIYHLSGEVKSFSQAKKQLFLKNFRSSISCSCLSCFSIPGYSFCQSVRRDKRILSSLFRTLDI